MPWGPEDAYRHNHAASTPEKAHHWATVANAALQEYGDDAKAIRTANAALAGTINYNRKPKSRLGSVTHGSATRSGARGDEGG